MNQRLIPICILTSFFIFACGGGEGTTGYTTEASDGCTPGSTQICAGPGACSGAQVCSEDGTYWGECVCGTPGTGGTDPSGTGGFIPGTGGDPGTGGGTINPPITGGTSGTGGTPQGTGGGTVCIPKTCDQIALDLTGWSQEALSYAPNPCTDLSVINICTEFTSAPLACGWAADGCGGLVDCGGCPEDGTSGISCGDSSFFNGTVVIPATANICGSRCALTNTDTSNRGACYQWGFGPQWAWECPSSIPPVGVSNCAPVDNQSWSNTTNKWCCGPA